MSELTEQVPERVREACDLVVALTDTFCDAHLNDEYKQLCREMAAAVFRENLPITRGKPQSWACGIVYALGRVNFLDDPAQTPHLTSDQVAEGFGVSKATMQAKAKVIREGLNLMPLHPGWTLNSKLADNPLVWMVEIDGFILDLRHAPRNIQQAAFEQGLIPFVPDDPQQTGDAEDVKPRLKIAPGTGSSDTANRQ